MFQCFKNFFKFGTENALFGYFLAAIFCKINTLEFVKIQNFEQKTKTFGLETKIIYLDIFRVKFEKTIGIFETTSSSLSERKVSCKNENPNTWDQKWLM